MTTHKLIALNDHLKTIGMSLISPHQPQGVAWLLEKEESQNGGLLCDDMGLGKTLQMITLFITNPLKRTLIVLPPALIPQWMTSLKRVLKTFTTNYYIKQFTSKTSAEIKSKLLLDEEPDTHYIIVSSYQMIIKRSKYLSRESCYPRLNFKWDRLILDEVHTIRNNKSKIYATIENTKAPIRWGMSGTPINNKLADLKNILSYVLNYREDERPLKELIDTFILRRIKQKVLTKPLPLCHIQDVSIPFQSQMEKDIYNIVSDNILNSIGLNNVNDIEHISLELFERLIRLRQISTCPSIAIEALNRKWFKRKPITDWNTIETPRFKEYIDKGIGQDIGNMSKVNYLVNDILKDKFNKNKYIIFCHFKDEIQFYKRILTEKGRSCCVIDGSVRKEERVDILNGFMCSKMDIRNIVSWKCGFSPNTGENDIISETIHNYLSYDIAIIQIDCGGTGLNLQGANRIYITGPHYNPAIEMQAIARAHRIGQKQPVLVKRLVLGSHTNEDEDYTIDSHIHSIQSNKVDIMVKYMKDSSYSMNTSKI